MAPSGLLFAENDLLLPDLSAVIANLKFLQEGDILVYYISPFIHHSLCPRFGSHGFTQPSCYRPICIVVCVCLLFRNWWNNLCWATVAQASFLQPMFTAGLGTFAPLYWTSNTSVSQYGRIQSHCWPCEPTLCSTVTTSQALQAPLPWVHPHSTGITYQRLFILLHSKAHLHFHFMSIRVSQRVTNTVMEGPVSRWPTHTMMQLSASWILHYEYTGMCARTWISRGDKNDEENLKALTRKTSSTQRCSASTSTLSQ